MISECVENCYYSNNISRNNSNESDFEKIYIGNFEIHDPVITTSGQSGYYGSGVVPIPFLNDVKVNVTFQALKINRQGRVYEGLLSPQKRISTIFHFQISITHYLQITSNLLLTISKP